MSSRALFLRHLWDEVINSHLRADGLDNIMNSCIRDPGAPFGDTGAVIRRLLDAGASRRDLSLFARATAYETAFGVLCALGDPGIDDGDVRMLHEELLAADPSGLEGRPGSPEGAP